MLLKLGMKSSLGRWLKGKAEIKAAPALGLSFPSWSSREFILQEGDFVANHVLGVINNYVKYGIRNWMCNSTDLRHITLYEIYVIYH